MLNCKEVTRLCSEQLERPLRLGERMRFHVHLLMCSGCRNYRDQVRTLRRLMQAYADGRTPHAAPDDDGDGDGDPARP